ncbi:MULTISPECIES: sn-glycerol-3-phosphate ABC transporter ATP-binding protein UgpC [unclassified Aureimonas]|uniref:sn-glycerol-3-phosphate ABC transporter ATP-binding protein UgpC n=1 Tax=unclassified Aureimonas TaxID=2615206 RepID=UPI0006F58C42|nr:MULTISPECIES: sn-glycerol-3-phosphate ABC transporter ATP-binding protein UgpC [unclassified Aureimonas]KQT68937.1 glycerol-3-phosphate transporter ATP-binding subunit [Aureimonas sp. Leaf460]KQT69164.1 glycerol-3-phosphate transporter ATP-binding subunit [Aureimonas sp. Leaf427]
MASITLKDVRKRYGETEAVRGISLEIADGELLVLVGPSGCGKSTLLRMIAGLETVTSGTIEIGGRVVNDLEPADRDIAMVFQNYALYPHMTVRQNLSYGLKNRGMKGAEIERRVAQAAASLEIAGFLDRRPGQLSGGQRQRVAMGRAIVREPAAFLFDEPLSNLDAKLRVQMRIEIRRLQRALATTSVYVTHDQMEAMTLADRLVVLNAGLVEQVGRPIDLYEKPASLFVAGFIGSPGMNLLPAARGGSALPGGGRLAGFAPAGDGPFTLGVRPEAFSLGEGPEAFTLGDGREGFSADVTVGAIELAGAESYVHGTPEGGASPLVFRVPGRTALEIGQRARIFAPSAALHAFGADGRRIAA